MGHVFFCEMLGLCFEKRLLKVAVNRHKSKFT